ncbi:MBL fold metallo-hydrolase [Rickettsiales endosymbiont of Stachyamoeba lipophora]|uniref:MBL fold metallo-hydrolase n=1 Tax=Rickettsiales endosymbiont of Stachyamoeba lipophora TaxID=2486578 RepID=UPI002407A068|nr:MBL fold metallo-hydrolase [Rickettsiales endosymbiont of Stachyamoeba lipophora]
MRYFGHACILLEAKQYSILLDPLISYDSQVSGDVLSLKDLPDQIDYLLISHNHQDHVVLKTLLQIRHKVKKVIVPSCNSGMIQDPSLARIFKHLGFNNVIELSELNSITDNTIKITALPFIGEHSDLDIKTKTGYHILLNGGSFVFLIDSRNMDPYIYDNVFSLLGKINYIFLGMECVGAPMSWLYGPLFFHKIDRNFDNQRRLAGSDFEKAKRLIQSSKCNNVFIYAMGLEVWLSHILTLNYDDNSP